MAKANRARFVELLVVNVVADNFDSGTWTDAYVFSLSSLSANDVIVDAVVYFRLSVEVPVGGARSAFVYVGYRVGNSTRRDFVQRFTRRRNPLPAQLCLRLRVRDAVVRERSPDRQLTTFVGLSASVGRHQRRHRRRRPSRTAGTINVSVLRQPSGPYLTIRTYRCNVGLWEMAGVPLLP